MASESGNTLTRTAALIVEPDKEVHLTDVLLLCTECQQPIKGRINTSQWIRVEYIGPEGECQACVQRKKGNGNTII